MTTRINKQYILDHYNIDELETDNEVIKRLIKLETDKRKALKKEAKELEEYKRLKAKFEKS